MTTDGAPTVNDEFADDVADLATRVADSTEIAVGSVWAFRPLIARRAQLVDVVEIDDDVVTVRYRGRDVDPVRLDRRRFPRSLHAGRRGRLNPQPEGPTMQRAHRYPSATPRLDRALVAVFVVTVAATIITIARGVH